METFEFQISLKIWHPSIDPGDISVAVGIAPKIMHKAGMPKKLPNGSPWKGSYAKSYWCADLVEFCETSSPSTIEEKLNRIIGCLAPKKDFFSKITHQGGQVQLWISTHSTKNYCVQLPCNPMKNLSNIGLEVLIDVYPCPQNW